MNYKTQLLITKDMEKAKKFYTELMGFHFDPSMDFGENVLLDCGISLQTEESFMRLIGKDGETGVVKYKGNDMEYFFEEDDFDGFLEKLKNFEPKVELVHDAVKQEWGTRVVRFYDPDGHMIEVGENIVAVFMKMFDEGKKIYEIAAEFGVPESMVFAVMQQYKMSQKK